MSGNLFVIIIKSNMYRYESQQSISMRIVVTRICLVFDNALEIDNQTGMERTMRKKSRNLDFSFPRHLSSSTHAQKKGWATIFLFVEARFCIFEGCFISNWSVLVHW